MVKLGAMVVGYSAILLLLFSVFVYLISTVKPEPIVAIISSTSKSQPITAVTATSVGATFSTSEIPTLPPLLRAKEEAVSNITQRPTEFAQSTESPINVTQSSSQDNTTGSEILAENIIDNNTENEISKQSKRNLPINKNFESEIKVDSSPKNRSKRMYESAGLYLVDRRNASSGNVIHSNYVINEIPIQRVYPPIPPSLRKQMEEEKKRNNSLINDPVKGHRRSVTPENSGERKPDAGNKYVIIDITDELANSNIQIKIGRRDLNDDPSKKYNISVRTMDDEGKTFRVDNTVIKIKYNDAWTTFMREGDNIQGDVVPVSFNSGNCNMFNSLLLNLLLLFYR